MANRFQPGHSESRIKPEFNGRSRNFCGAFIGCEGRIYSVLSQVFDYKSGTAVIINWKVRINNHSNQSIEYTKDVWVQLGYDITNR